MSRQRTRCPVSSVTPAHSRPFRRRTAFFLAAFLRRAGTTGSAATRETRIGRAAKGARHKRKILRQHIVKGAFWRFRRDTEPPAAFIEIAAAGQILEILDEDSVVGATGLVAVGGGAFLSSVDNRTSGRAGRSRGRGPSRGPTDHRWEIRRRPSRGASSRADRRRAARAARSESRGNDTRRWAAHARCWRRARGRTRCLSLRSASRTGGHRASIRAVPGSKSTPLRAMPNGWAGSGVGLAATTGRNGTV